MTPISKIIRSGPPRQRRRRVSTGPGAEPDRAFAWGEVRRRIAVRRVTFIERNAMKRLMPVFAGMTLVVAGFALAAAADDEATPTIKEVMEALHKGQNSPMVKLKKQLQTKPTKW